MLWWVSVRLNQGPSHSLSLYIIYPQVSVISSGSLTALQPQILTIFTKFPSLPSLLPSPPNGNVFSAVMQSLVFAPAPWFSVCRLPKFYHTGREQSSGRKLDISFWWFSDFQLTSSQSRVSFSISFLLLLKPPAPTIQTMVMLFSPLLLLKIQSEMPSWPAPLLVPFIILGVWQC